MARLFVDTDKFADGEGPPIVEAFHSALKDLVRRTDLPKENSTS